jgi:hypothetical protein
VRPGFLDHPPKRVAVLPFVITYPYDLADNQTIPSAHTIGRDVLRKTFYYAFTPYGYEDVKLSEVDERLAKTWGSIEQGAWRAADPKALGQALGVDALIYGEVKRLMHFSTPLYTETSVDVSLRMVDAMTGEVLWRQRALAAERGGALLKKGQVVDFLADQLRSFKPSVKFLRVSDMAITRLLKNFPNPPMSVEAKAKAATATREPGRAIRLAVLPLEAKRRQRQNGAEKLRSALVANLQESPFEVIEIQRVDAALKERGWKEGEPLPELLSLPELASALGSDAFLRGEVTSWGRGYLVVESWVKAGLQLQLVDAASQTVIWSDTKKNTRQAGVLKGPTGYTSLATAPIMGLKSIYLDEVVNRLTRSMIQKLNSSPAVLTYVSEKTP